ncbi:hypothetical protein COL00_30620, partial [Bacillus cereus]|uniref:insecticidal delta-endotoxin Cry8Ea1 family protein n=2 Tax=Bacillus cereus TaxID=1396 RepID=UPI000C003303
MSSNYNNDEFEIMANGGMAYQPKYPLAQEPGSELQGMNYKDWMNRCVNPKSGEIFGNASGAVRDAVATGVKLTGTLIGVVFPPAKVIGQILGAMISILWPKEAGPPGTTEAQFTWQQMMSAAEELMDQKIEALVKDRAIESLRILQSRILDYQQALCNLQTDPNNERFKEDVRREFNDAEDQAKAAMIQLGNPNYAIPLLADYAQAANLHLLVLRDVVQYGESWGFSALEVQQYYFNSQVGNPGLKQLLAIYTDHCVRYYNEGLTNRYETGNWNKFNDYRRDMTLMTMDIVSVWPTYDPIIYTIPTKSQLTRTVYTPYINRNPHSSHPISEVEHHIVGPPSLFRWLREQVFYMDPAETTTDPPYWSSMIQRYQYTMNDYLYEELKGNPLDNLVKAGSLTIPNPLFEDDVWSIIINQASNFGYLRDFTFQLTKTEDQKISFNNNGSGQLARFGLPCGPNNANDCNPCEPCDSLPNASDPCNDKSLYSHRFSNTGIYRVPLLTSLHFGYGWTHVSADAANLIEAENITQIPAVKGYDMGPNATVIKGPGSTGGDLVQLVSRTGSLEKLRIRVKGQVNKGYQLRIRYALASDRRETIYINRYVNNAGNWQRDYGGNANSTPTYLGGSLNYNSFGYTTQEIPFPPTSYEEWDIELGYPSIGNPIIIDKIEFIPIEGSVEEFEANQAVEKARKAVNALFTNEAKNALQLHVTDYAVDQAANLVECVSEEFHAQEKMILLDQVKFAKRLSQARNLLNY